MAKTLLAVTTFILAVMGTAIVVHAAEIKLLIAGQPLEERRSPRIEPKNEKPTPVPSKGVVRPAPSISPHEKPSPA